MERKRLLVLSTHADSPGQRFRIHTWSPYLGGHGIDVVEHPFATPALQRLLSESGRPVKKAIHTVIAHAAYALRPLHQGAYDAVLVYREALPLGPPIVERRLGRSGSPPMIYDIDDPIFLPAAGGSPAGRLRSVDKWKTISSLSVLTVCINEMIADVVRPYAQRVAVVPNAIDLNRYPVKVRRSVPGALVLGYSGSHSTMRQLSEICGALERVAHEVPIQVHAVGGDPCLTVDRVPIVLRPWSASEEVNLLHDFDVGLAPTPLDRWSEYKSSSRSCSTWA